MKRLLIYITTLCFLNSCLSSSEKKVLDISAVDFSSKIITNPGIILDVRTVNEINNGHIENASFIDFYDENFNNQVWSHVWQFWEGTSKRTGETIRGPVNASFKWVDGKIVNASWIFDPSIKIQEIMASQK